MARKVDGDIASDRYPLLLDSRDRKDYPLLPETVPLGMVDTVTARRQACANHGQTLDELARRGGLHPVELVAVMDGKPYPVGLGTANLKAHTDWAAAEVLRRVAKYLQGAADPVEVVAAWAWVCPLCKAANSFPAADRPTAAGCSFCKVAYKPVYPPGPEGDATTPSGAGGEGDERRGDETQADPPEVDRGAGAAPRGARQGGGAAGG